MGTVVYKGKTLRVSDQNLHSSDNVINMTSLALSQFKKEIETLGFTLEDLQTSGEKRLLFNCKVLYNWSQNYQYIKPTATKRNLFSEDN